MIMSLDSKFASSSSKVFTTTALAFFFFLPIAVPLPRISETFSIFKRLVEPAIPVGTPAVKTTKSPDFKNPFLTATSIEASIRLSVSLKLRTLTGLTPQTKLS